MKSKIYMPALTGIRAIAAYLVFFHHYNTKVFPAFINRLFWEFHIGVNIFFVLSGFLIYYRYYNHVQLGRKWLGQYFMNRVARIYPVYAILTLASFYFFPKLNADTSVFFGGAQDHLNLLLLNLTFLKGFFYNFVFTGIAQSWTLTIEECFYLLAPLFFLLLRKNKNFFVYLPLLITAIGIMLVKLMGPYSAGTHAFYGDSTFMYLYTFNGTCIEFFIGMFLARIVLNNEAIVSRKPLFTFLGALIMSMSLMILCSFKQTDMIISGLYHPLGTLTDHVFLPIGTAVFFYGLIKEQTLIKNLLSSRIMVLLGKSSYVFYLIHIGFIALFLNRYTISAAEHVCQWMDTHHLGSLSSKAFFNPVLNIAMKFILLNGIAILIFKFIEEPLNNSIRKLYQRIFKRDSKELPAENKVI